MKLNNMTSVTLIAPLALLALAGCGEADDKGGGATGDETAGSEAAGEGEGEGEGEAGEGEGEAGEGEGEAGEGEGEGEAGEGEGEGEASLCVPGDLAATLANSPYAAAAAVDNAVIPAFVDRVGRPGINTALVATVYGAEAAEAYNQSSSDSWPGWGPKFAHALWVYGCLDGVEGGLLDGVGFNAEAVAGLLAGDLLTIDTSHPYGANRYLGYEDNTLGGPVMGMAFPGGGRTLTEDTIKFTVQALVGADAYPAVPQDGDFPTEPDPTVCDGCPAWPYLAPAH